MTYTHPDSYDEQTIRAHLIDAHRTRADRILTGFDFLVELHNEAHAERDDLGHVHEPRHWQPRRTEVGEAVAALVAACRQAVGELGVHTLVERVRSDDGWRDDVRAAVRRCFERPEAAVRAPAHRQPYVGAGADGARRSATIDREEADIVDRDDPRHAELLASAEEWDQQARDLDRGEHRPAPRRRFYAMVDDDGAHIIDDAPDGTERVLATFHEHSGHSPRRMAATVVDVLNQHV